MQAPVIMIFLVIAAALLFDFANGWNDSANAIATVVSTKVLSPLSAVLLAGFLNFLGAYLSTRVARTIGSGLVDPAMVTQGVVLAAMLAAFLWTLCMTVIGLPISASHSLIGGLIGAAVFSSGVPALKANGIIKVFVALMVSPVFGLGMGFMMMALLMHVFKKTSPMAVNRYFGRLQLVSVSFMALTHGMNDAQKVMGVITMALLSGGYINTFDVPLWVTTLCAVVMGLGTAVGGWRVMKTLGLKLCNIRPVHGFAAETAASMVLFGAAHLGLPVSTTHVITTSIMGVGATKRLSAVRWGIGKKIFYAWVFTLPACGIMAGVMSLVINAVAGT